MSCGRVDGRKSISRGSELRGVDEKGLLEFVLGVRRTWHKTFQPGGKALQVGNTASSGRRLEKIAKSKRSR